MRISEFLTPKKLVVFTVLFYVVLGVSMLTARGNIKNEFLKKTALALEAMPSPFTIQGTEFETTKSLMFLGFSKAEATGAWSITSRPTISFKSKEPAPHDMKLGVELRAAPHPNIEKLSVTVKINGEKLTTIFVPKSGQEFDFFIPKAFLASEWPTVNVAFEIEEIKGFFFRSQINDPRQLGIWLSSVKVS